MPFTNKDLAWAKKEFTDRKNHSEIEDHVIIDLIARLEAGEGALKGFIDLESDKVNLDEVRQRLVAWRKSGGPQYP